jgi:UDP-N-acetylmuramyl pentapeptide synthase
MLSFPSFKERLLWRRAREYLQTYEPTVVAVAGTRYSSLVQQALWFTLQPFRFLPARLPQGTSALEVAEGVLGILAPASATWYQLLTRSLVREITQSEPDTLLLELGVRRPGDMDRLATQLPVTVGVLTDVGTAHLTLFGSIEARAHEFESLTAAMTAGYAVINGDEPLLAAAALHTRAHVITFGMSPEADITFSRLQRSGEGLAGEIAVKGQAHEVHLPHILGRQQAHALLAVVGVAQALQLPLGPVIERLQTCKPPARQLQLVSGMRGARILDDTHDASLESALAALETLRALSARRRVAILGDITDLGGESYRAHKRLGKFAGEVAQVVIAVGREMRTGGAEAVFVGADVHHFDKAEDVGKWLQDFLQPEDLILITGSADMHMEKVVERLGARY